MIFLIRCRVLFLFNCNSSLCSYFLISMCAMLTIFSNYQAVFANCQAVFANGQAKWSGKTSQKVKQNGQAVFGNCQAKWSSKNFIWSSKNFKWSGKWSGTRVRQVKIVLAWQFAVFCLTICKSAWPLQWSGRFWYHISVGLRIDPRSWVFGFDRIE